MRFNFFRKKEVKKVEPVEQKEECTPYTGGQQEVLLQHGDFLEYAIGNGAGLTGYENLTYQRAMQFYSQSNSVATAVDIISQEISRIDPVIKNPDGTLNDTSPLLDKLKNPNDWNESWSFFIGSMARSYLLTGDAFTYGSGVKTQPPLEIYSLKPQNVSSMSGSNDQRPQNFTIYNGDGQGSYSRTREKTGFRFYDKNLKELWHTMAYSSSSSNIRGDSPLKAICLDINSQIKGRIHNVKLLDNGARPSLLVAFKDTLSPDQHIERRGLINEQMAGTDNAGKIAVISSTDMELKELGITNKDMDYAMLEKIAEQSVYNRYRIPLPLVSNDANTFNNMENAVYFLYDFAVLPNVDALFSSLTMFLMPRYGLDPEQYQLTYNPDTIDALKKRRVEILLQRKTLGVETINEIRQDLPNREPVENGDVIYQASTQVPLGTDLTEPDENEL